MPNIEEPAFSLEGLIENTNQGDAVNDINDPLRRVENVFQLWWHYADFGLAIISPNIQSISPPIILHPETIPGTSETEFVYPIFDYGYKLATSKAQDMYTAGMSMCKLFYTIEKIVYLVIERLKTGGILHDDDGDEGGTRKPPEEVEVILLGHELAMRKAFESIISLQDYNVVVTNFDPGLWGERYLRTVKWLAEKGYGCPPKTPRDTFRQSHGTTPTLGG